MTTTVPFFDLSVAQQPFASELEDAAKAVIAGGWYINGRHLATFETAFAHYCGTRHCVGVASGLDALILVLRAWKVQGRLRNGDGVVVAANTFIATIMAILENGLKPVLVEPDPKTCNLSPSGLLAVIEEQRPKAVIAVHLYGQLCPMPELREICDRDGLLLLEDSAQAHGAMIDGRKAGSFGHAAAFSFYPAKNLGALGDGGAVTTDDEELATLLYGLRNYGSEQKYVHHYQGLNSRLDDLQAAFLSVKLPHLDAQNRARRAVADRYLGGIVNDAVTLPTVLAEPESHVWHLFVVHCARREALATHLAAQGIQTAIHYPIAPHRQECYSEVLKGSDLPLTERLHDEALSLPMSPALTDEQIERTISAVNAFDIQAGASAVA